MSARLQISRFWARLFIFASMIGTGTGVTAAQSPLTQAEIDKARLVEAEVRRTISPETMGTLHREKAIPALAGTPAGQEGRSVVVDVRLLGSPATIAVASARMPPMTRRTEVTRYDYATGITTRSIIELDSEKSLHVSTDVHYPTPLADEELRQALAIARSTSPAIDEAARALAPGALDFSYLVPIDSSPRSETYGHRLVVVWFENPQMTDRILVDLSTGRALSNKY